MPVNTLVIIAIAVIVMLGLIAMYMAGTGPFTVVVEMSARGSACSQLNSANCKASLNSIPIDFGNYTNLYDYCEAKYKQQYGDENLESNVVENYCKAIVCSCPGATFEPP